MTIGMEPRHVDKAKLARNCWCLGDEVSKLIISICLLLGSSSASYVRWVWSLGRSIRLTTFTVRTALREEEDEGGRKPLPNSLRG